MNLHATAPRLLLMTTMALVLALGGTSLLAQRSGESSDRDGSARQSQDARMQSDADAPSRSGESKTYRGKVVDLSQHLMSDESDARTWSSRDSDKNRDQRAGGQADRDREDDHASADDARRRADRPHDGEGRILALLGSEKDSVVARITGQELYIILPGSKDPAANGSLRGKIGQHVEIEAVAYRKSGVTGLQVKSVKPYQPDEADNTDVGATRERDAGSSAG